MKTTRTLLSLLAIALLCVPAQGRTWVVDASNGPGTDFTDLPSAVAAAVDGDTLRVRAGTYTPVTIAKAITVLGEAGVSLDPLASAPLVIDAIPAGKTCVVEGFYYQWFGRSPAIRIQNCAGRVVLQGVVSFGNGLASLSDGPALQVVQSSNVALTECDLRGSPALEATDSSIVIVNGKTLGQDGHPNVVSLPGVGLEALRSNITVTEGYVRGGRGSTVISPLASEVGIRAVDSEVVVSGDPTTILAGLAGVAAMSAIEMTNGRLIIDPHVILVPFMGAPPIVGTATVDVRRVPALRARGVPIGGTVEVDLFSPAGEAVALFMSLPSDPIAVLGIGVLHLDPHAFFLVATGVQGAAEHWVNNLSVPADPFLIGLALVLQGSSGGVSVPLRLTNPAYVVLD